MSAKRQIGDHRAALAQCDDTVSPDTTTEVIRVSESPINAPDLKLSKTVDEEPANRSTRYRNADSPHPTPELAVTLLKLAAENGQRGTPRRSGMNPTL